MAVAYLGLGSNLGDKKQYLHQAIQGLYRHESMDLLAISSIYESEPWGGVEQDVFLNLVSKIETDLAPADLLAVCLALEAKLERVRLERWGPRTMDIDILWYEGWEMATPELVIPHPYLLERDFVVIPFGEIAPELVIGDRTMSRWADDFVESGIKKVKSSSTSHP